MEAIFLFWGFAGFMFGIGVGTKTHKRKRDKQMAHLIADRLLGKKDEPQAGNATGPLYSISQAHAALKQQQAATLAANVNMMIGGNAHGSGQGYGNRFYDLDSRRGSKGTN